jgi:Rad3-related DNA helicase
VDELREKLEKQHRAIDDAVGKTQKLLDSGIETAFRDLKQQVAELHDLVAINFEHEESIGKLEDVVDDFPRLSSSIDKFNKEHGELLRELARLRDFAADLSSLAGSRVQTLRDEFDTFSGKLESHEKREFEAIQEAYTTDVSTAD